MAKSPTMQEAPSVSPRDMMNGTRPKKRDEEIPGVKLAVACDSGSEDHAVEIRIMESCSTEASLSGTESEKDLNMEDTFPQSQSTEPRHNGSEATSSSSSCGPSSRNDDEEDGIDDRTDDILSEARSAISGLMVNVPQTPCDERTQQIINDVRHHQSPAERREVKMRSTREVLELAGRVLSESTYITRGARYSIDDAMGTHPERAKEVASTEYSSTPSESAQSGMSPLARATSPRPTVSPTSKEPRDTPATAYVKTVLSTSISEDTPNSLKDTSNKSDQQPPPKRASFAKEESSHNDVINLAALFSLLRGGGGGGSARMSSPPPPSSSASLPDTPHQNSNTRRRPPRRHHQRLLQSYFHCGDMQQAADLDHIRLHNDSSLMSHNNSMLPSPIATRPIAMTAPRASYVEAMRSTMDAADDRMPTWVLHQSARKEDFDLSQPLPPENFYSFGTSRTVLVHEIVRGDWTWCTAWSPDGARLAIATENHHLAVVETTASTVWRVQHDRRLKHPPKSNTTQSVRAIAWGRQFIAIGGTGNAVSILAPIDPYPILHTIVGTGFVGSLSWRTDTSVLAIASRQDKCLVVKVSATDGDDDGPLGSGRHIKSKIIATLPQDDWVNAVAFSPGGTMLAVGDKSGKLSLYNYDETPLSKPKVTSAKAITVKDAILDVEWSSDGRWLYVGGEDYAITVIDTLTWKKVHRISRERWVQFIASSNRGTHVAVGGVASEVTILDVNNKWRPVMNIELKGLVPLSARWHPLDQYLVLTGQTNTVVAVETTNARHISGHCIRSMSAILVVEFSPDGRMVVIGNEAGVISFFSLSGTTFVMAYELVIETGDSLSIHWSSNGKFVVVGSGDSVVIVGKTNPSAMGAVVPPNSSGFCVKKVIRGLDKVHSVSIDDQSRYIAVSGKTTRILDAADNFACVREWKRGTILANSWSPDCAWLAAIGRTDHLTIYETSSERLGQWRVTFTLQAERAGHALAWGPSIVGGLQYLAYGGEDSKVTIIEIRTTKETWETVLEIPRAGVIHDLDWSQSGILAVAISDGTVTVIDLTYLHSGWAVNEMDYNWQRQGITCFTEIRRNKGINSMKTVRWIPGTGHEHSLLAIGGTDGEVEILDLTERRRCRGFGTGSDDESSSVEHSFS